MKTTIEIEEREINGILKECYVPKINDINITSSNILKESILTIRNDKGKIIDNKISDNKYIAEIILNNKIEEILKSKKDLKVINKLLENFNERT